MQNRSKQTLCCSKHTKPEPKAAGIACFRRLVCACSKCLKEEEIICRSTEQNVTMKLVKLSLVSYTYGHPHTLKYFETLCWMIAHVLRSADAK